jgi:hypothetical protein
MRTTGLTLALLLSVAASADPIPLPDPCRTSSVKKKGETCVACDPPKSDPKACETQHASDGFARRCTSDRSSQEVWCKNAPRVKE